MFSKINKTRLLLVLVWLVSGCQPPPAAPAVVTSTPGVIEYPVRALPLSGPLAEPQAELSGLAWYGDTLLLLPQYPRHVSMQPQGAIFGLARTDLEAALHDPAFPPLKPHEIPILGNVQDRTPGFDGFEAIACMGERVYLAIEARQADKMLSYLVRGRLAPDLSSLTLEPDSLIPNPLPQQFDNQSDEALLVDEPRLLSFYEVNGAGLNPHPHVSQFDADLQPLASLPFPALEYRLTDATALDQQQRFWVMNYFYPGDQDLLPEQDALRATYGAGETHRASQVVERLVEFQLTPQGIQRTERAPIWLQLLPNDEARNWEGLARFPGVGFLLASDKFPATLLGVVQVDP